MTDGPRVVRGTVDVGGRTVGYRVAGHGPAVVLVGSLDHSTAADRTLIAALADVHTVLAIDPPGLGFSDPLPPAGGTPGAGDVPAIAAAVSATLTALGLGRAAVVGRHSGGAVALELTLSDPGRYPLLVLDDVPLLDADDRARWATEHGRPVEVRDDGTHLIELWYRRRRAFVHTPWFDRSSTLDLDLTAPEVLDEAIHAAVLDQLDALDRHPVGDRAAFEYDTVAALLATTVAVVAPTPSHPSLGRPGAVRPDIELPPCPPELAARRAALVAALRSWSGPAVRLAETEVALGRWTVQLPDTPWGQVAARRFRPAHDVDALPVVLLHASPLSGESLLPLARELAAEREVVVLDTLGNGDSDKPDAERHPRFRVPEIADLAQVALAAVAALGIERYDLFGTHTGAMIGLETAIAAPERIGALVLDGLPLLDGAGAAAALPEDFHVDLTPRWDGSHLVTAWSNVVDVLTWYPWNRRDPAHRRPLVLPSTPALHRRAVQMLKSGTSYLVSSTAVSRHATTSRLPLLRVPTAFCRAPADPMAGYVEQCLAVVAGSEVLDLAADHAVDARRIRHWLDTHTARLERR